MKAEGKAPEELGPVEGKPPHQNVEVKDPWPVFGQAAVRGGWLGFWFFSLSDTGVPAGCCEERQEDQ